MTKTSEAHWPWLAAPHRALPEGTGTPAPKVLPRTENPAPSPIGYSSLHDRPRPERAPTPRDASPAASVFGRRAPVGQPRRASTGDLTDVVSAQSANDPRPARGAGTRVAGEWRAMHERASDAAPRARRIRTATAAAVEARLRGPSPPPPQDPGPPRLWTAPGGRPRPTHVAGGIGDTDRRTRG